MPCANRRAAGVLPQAIACQTRSVAQTRPSPGGPIDSGRTNLITLRETLPSNEIGKRTHLEVLTS